MLNKYLCIPQVLYALNKTIFELCEFITESDFVWASNVRNESPNLK